MSPKLRCTVSPISPPAFAPMLVELMKTCYIVHFRKSSWPSPDLRTVTTASSKCLPDAQFFAITGAALS